MSHRKTYLLFVFVIISMLMYGTTTMPDRKFSFSILNGIIYNIICLLLNCLQYIFNIIGRNLNVLKCIFTQFFICITVCYLPIQLCQDISTRYRYDVTVLKCINYTHVNFVPCKDKNSFQTLDDCEHTCKVL